MCLTFHCLFVLHHTQHCVNIFHTDFLICASCHRAGHYELERVHLSGMKHKVSRTQVKRSTGNRTRGKRTPTNHTNHTQFTLRMRFWSKKALLKKLKELDLELGGIYEEDESWPARRTVLSVCEDFEFYLGQVRVEGLAEVHGVNGDGNCGFYVFLIALAVLMPESESRLKDQLRMRQLLQEEAHGLKDEMLRTFPALSYLSSEEALIDWEKCVNSLYQEDIDYENGDFMKKIDKNGRLVNDEHWMDGEFASYIFSKVYKVRIALYMEHNYNGLKTWKTSLFDGRKGTVTCTLHDSQVPVDPDATTFGIHYDGSHYQYINIT
jgi:hypothetical protein